MKPTLICSRCAKSGEVYVKNDHMICLHCGKITHLPPQSPTKAIICFVLLLCVWLVVLWALFNGHFLPF
jgi:recombinational DNA repair protein (RecF pathway)